MAETHGREPLQEIDLANVDLDQLDSLAPGVIRDAIESVIRRNALPSDHRDHGSHSNNPEG